MPKRRELRHSCLTVFQEGPRRNHWNANCNETSVTTCNEVTLQHHPNCPLPRNQIVHLPHPRMALCDLRMNLSVGNPLVLTDSTLWLQVLWVSLTNVLARMRYRRRASALTDGPVVTAHDKERVGISDAADYCAQRRRE